MSDIEQAGEAAPVEELERYIMDPCQPKSEQEWWACREIERLRKERDGLRELVSDVVEDPGPFETEWNKAARQALKDET